MSTHRRLDCKLCGGHQTVSVSRGRKVERVAQCFRCHVAYRELAAAFGWPLEKKTDRRRPPRRGTDIDIAIAELVVDLEDRRERLLAKLPSAEWLELNGEIRREMNMARTLRSLATDLGPCDMAWDFALEAAQRELRARWLIIELDQQLETMNPTRQAFLAGVVEVTT